MGDTAEFKNFLVDFAGNDIIAAPPNTPAEPADYKMPDLQFSPQPCSSKTAFEDDLSDFKPQGSSMNQSILSSRDDDDITLEDLVAMETMEDEDEADSFFNLTGSSTNPLEPFMNSIFQDSKKMPLPNTPTFENEKTTSKPAENINICKKSSNKNHRVKKSKKKVETSREKSPPHSQ